MPTHADAARPFARDGSTLVDLLETYSDEHLAGKPVPTPGASQDGMVPIYDHSGAAIVWVDPGTEVDDDTITLAKLNATIKPTTSGGSATPTDPAVRVLGSGATQAAAGNDARFPSAGEKSALAGTSGTPGSGNKYVTDGDARNSDQRTPTNSSVTWAKIAGALVAGGANTLVADPGGAAGDLLVRSGATFAALAKPGSPLGHRLIVRTDGTVSWSPPPEFHVSAWGAVGDGTADDQPALQGAYTACETAGGGKVVLMQGATHKLNSTGPIQVSRNGTSGTVGSRGWVVVDGRGATIKHTSTVYRAFDAIRQADYDVIARVGFENVTVDAQSVARSDNNHVLFGNLIDGSWSQRLNFRWIYAKNCRTINVPAANTDGNTTGSRQSISLGSRHLGAGEGTQTYVRDILDVDCEFSGGVGIFAGGTGAGSSGVNVYCDNLRSVRLTHDTGVTPTAPPGSISHCAIQQGGTGFGGSASVIGLRSFNSNDVGLEQDAMQTVENDDCIVTDAWNVAFLPRNFATPTDLTQQTYTYRNCWNVVKNINPPVTSVYLGNAYGWFLSGSGAPTFGHVILENCGNLNKATGLKVNGEAIACPELPIRKLTLSNFKAIHETVSDSPGSAPTWSFIRWAPSVASELEIKGIHYSLNGTYGGPAAALRFLTLEGAGPTTLTIDDPIYECPISASGSTLYPVWYGKAAGSANASVAGVTRRRRARNWTTTASTKVRGIVGDPALTIPTELLDIDCDHSGFPSATAADVLFGDTTNRPKVKSRGGTPVNAGTVASAATLTLPDKGDSFVISGTIGITAITPSWNTRVVRLRFLGTLTVTDDGGALNLAGNFPAANNGILTVECDGTNWREVARSVN